MASNETVLAWKAQLLGADGVKDGLRKINAEVKAGTLTQGEANKAISSASRETKNYRAEQNLLVKSFQAAHPQMAKFSRAMSTVSSVARTGLNIVNSLNLMWIRQGQQASKGADLNYEAALAQRNYNDAVKNFGPDSKEAREALGELNHSLSEIKNFKLENTAQQFTDIGTYALDATLIISTLVNVLTKFPAAMALLTNPITAMFAAVVIGGFLLGRVIGDFVVSALDAIPYFYYTSVEPALYDMVNFFTQTIPMALGTLGEFLVNFFLTQLPEWITAAFVLLSTLFTTGWNGLVQLSYSAINGIIKGIEGMVNVVVKGINRIISAYNSIARKIHLPTIGKVSGISLPTLSVPTIAAANGFDGMVNSPTMFLTGEAGPEHVSVSPGGKSGGSGGNLVINIQGSLISERELFGKVDTYFKNELKKRNFRMLQ